MNLLLLHQEQMLSETRARLSSRQQEHIGNVLKLKTGETLRVGMINGALGEARLLHDPSSSDCEIEVAWNNKIPPVPLDLTVCLALPRPKAFRRLLFSLAILGIKNIHVFHAYKVEKSYWTSPFLKPASVNEFLLHGLEQAGDTLLPTVHFHRRFRPFVEDDLPMIGKDKACLVLDKRGESFSSQNLHKPTCVVIGPEGGFIDFEVGLLQENGFKAYTLGERILTVELAATTFSSLFRL